METNINYSHADLILNGVKFQLPFIHGVERQSAIDIRELRKETGFITYDNGFANTGSCLSNITFVDGEKSILRYWGYSIDDLAE